MEHASNANLNPSASKLERVSTRSEGGEPRTVGDRTMAVAPKRVDSISGKQELDIEKAIPRPIADISAPVEIPDGGWTAWLTVVGCWCIMFSTFGMINAFGVYQDFYVRFYLPSYSPSAIGWIGSTQLFFQASMGFFAGKLFDAGYFYYMVPLSCLLYVFAYFMLSLAQQDAFYQIFLSQGVAAGIAFGFVFLPITGVLSHHFKRRWGLAIGIITSGSGLGGLVFPFMLNKLISEAGFAKATRVVAAVFTLMMLLACLLMRTRLPPPSKSKQSQGIESYIPPPTAKQLVTDTGYMFTIAGVFISMIGTLSLPFYFQLYSVVQGIDHDLAFYVITIFNAAAIIGRLIPNFLGDIWGPLNVILVCNLSCAILVFSMLGATNAAGIVSIAVLYGLLAGGAALLSLFGPVIASLAKSPSEIGIRLGFGYTIVAFASLIGIPISGALLTQTLLWERMLCFSGACMILGSGFLFAARHVTAKEKRTWKV